MVVRIPTRDYMVARSSPAVDGFIGEGRKICPHSEARILEKAEPESVVRIEDRIGVVYVKWTIQ